MEIWADLRHKVEVDPIDVLEKIKEEELGSNRDWVCKKENKYYQVTEESAGQHSFDTEEEISKEKYDCIQSIDKIIKYLTAKIAKTKKLNEY